MTRPGEVSRVLDRLMAAKWVVYSKHCLNHSARVIEYLARHTHRIAITDARIVRVDNNSVTLRYRGYADHVRTKELTLDGPEFVRRFLMHIVPKGLMRVRHFGFLINRCRKRKLSQVRAELAMGEETRTRKEKPVQSDAPPCPICGKGR